MRSVELFAGCGGLALGLARAGFRHELVVEVDPHAIATLEENKRRGVEHVAHWPIKAGDVHKVDYSGIAGDIDLVAGGPPCQPFSIGGRHLGPEDDRNLWPEAIRAVRELRPKAFIFENVRGLLRPAFDDYLTYLKLCLASPEIVVGSGESWLSHLHRLQRRTASDSATTYKVVFRAINTADYGAPQQRHRAIAIGVRSDIAGDWTFGGGWAAAKRASKPVADELAKPAATTSAKQGGNSGSGRASKRRGKATARVVPRRPTHKLRLRALSNRIKSKLLGDAHDPMRPQAKEVASAAIRVLGEGADSTSGGAAFLVDSPVVDKRTFEEWWRGSVGRVWTPKLEACDRLIRGSSFWLKNSCFGEPVQRHFDALDVRCDDRMPKDLSGKRGEAWLAARMDLMDKCLQAADRCWSVFSYRVAPSSEALALMSQIAPGGVLPAPSLLFAPPAVRAHAFTLAGQELCNLYMYEAHTRTRHLHNVSAKFGLMRFLVRLGAAMEGSRPWWYVGWVFDLASVAAMAHFFLIFGPAGSPESNVGEDVDLVVAVSRIFFDHEYGTVTPLLTDLPKIAKRLDLPPGQLTKSLMAARREYYAQLAALGISFEDVYAFAKPVEVMGAKSIEQNIIWRGAPPARWQS